MAEINPEVKPDEYTVRHRDIGCDGEQRSLIPKRLVVSEEQGKKASWWMELMPQVITQLKIAAWLYVFGSIVTFFILAILFMQGRFHFQFNNANCAVECFTNLLDQSIPNVAELHKKLNETVEDQKTCKEKLNAYKTYLDFIKSIDKRIQNMDTCNAHLKLHCDCLRDEDLGCAKRYFQYLNCEDTLSQNYHDKIKASYGQLLKDVIMVKKNLTDFLITGNFEMMKEIYERKKHLPMDNCQFICSLDIDDLNTQTNATYWKKFEEGWKLFSEYIINLAST